MLENWGGRPGKAGVKRSVQGAACSAYALAKRTWGLSKISQGKCVSVLMQRRTCAYMAQGWRAELAAGARVGRQRESAVESECAVMCPHVKDFVSTRPLLSSSDLTCEIILLIPGSLLLAYLTKEENVCDAVQESCRTQIAMERAPGKLPPRLKVGLPLTRLRCRQALKSGKVAMRCWS